MAYSKAHNFTPQSYYLSLVCKALSHPARVEILNAIITFEKPNFEILQSVVPLKATTISSHIRFLRDMRIVLSNNKKREIIYTLNKDLENTCKDILKIIALTKEKSSDVCAGEIIWMERMRGVKSYTSY